MYANDATGVNAGNGQGISEEVKDEETRGENEHDGTEQIVLGQAVEKTDGTRLRPGG